MKVNDLKMTGGTEQLDRELASTLARIECCFSQIIIHFKMIIYHICPLFASFSVTVLNGAL